MNNLKPIKHYKINKNNSHDILIDKKNHIKPINNSKLYFGAFKDFDYNSSINIYKVLYNDTQNRQNYGREFNTCNIFFENVYRH